MSAAYDTIVNSLLDYLSKSEHKFRASVAIRW